MLRIALIIALLASLVFFSVRQLTQAPDLVSGMNGERSQAKARPEPLPGGKAGLLQGAAPSLLPDIYDGYLFVEERKLEAGDFGEFGEVNQEATEETGVVLDQVYYSGSLIIGELRQALITYQENNGANVAAARTVRGRTVRRGPANSESALANKMVKTGERFRGYVVSSIEPDKIVFVKGNESVERFLFDQDKKRISAGKVSRAQTGQSEASGVAMVPPAVTPTAPVDLPPSVRIVPPTAATAPTPRLRRSQRLLGAGQALGIPTLPVPAARAPVPSKN